MASKRTQIDNDTLDMFNELGSRVKQSRAKEHKEPFKKPTSDYYRLDLVVRDSVPGDKGHNVMIKDIKTDYRAYLDSVRGTQSITKYIHNLIDKDMARHNKASK